MTFEEKLNRLKKERVDALNEYKKAKEWFDNSYEYNAKYLMRYYNGVCVGLQLAIEIMEKKEVVSEREEIDIDEF